MARGVNIDERGECVSGREEGENKVVVGHIYWDIQSDKDGTLTEWLNDRQNRHQN